MRVEVEDGQVSLARPGIETVKDKFLGSRDIEQTQIFGGRADENQVVVLGVIQREQGAAFDANGTIEKIEDPIELVDRQDLSHPGVVVENEGALVGRGIEVAHSCLRSSHKAAI